ncbi:hypothetical protein [Embleya sp. NBC_00896]|uniref:hypothetical protein n=1 Tax=Embleya sp. NBC_00896 TaxID=2975961 RepID=UPI002F9193F4|nr:hypothetical protein OG928_48095 [Embleya sp. NBC_00896]
MRPRPAPRLRRIAWTTAVAVVGSASVVTVGITIALDRLGCLTPLGSRARRWLFAFGDHVAEPLCDLAERCLDRLNDLGHPEPPRFLRRFVDAPPSSESDNR